MKFIDLTGQRFGRLNVIGRAENSKNGDVKFKCKCDCGNEVIVFSHNLKRGTSKSCGCLIREITSKRTITHGKTSTNKKTNTRLYQIWADLKRRCENSNRENYQYYGARGIKVCDEWKSNFMSFYNWSMENGYDDYLTIDRMDSDGDYEPSNCRWATKKEQNNNKSNVKLYEFDGKKLTLSAWAEETGIHRLTIWDRLRNGWSIERALTKPVKKQKNSRLKTS